MGGIRGINVPTKYAGRNQRLELTGLASLYQRKYQDAIESFEAQYALLLEAERESGQPIHKGAPLYNLGIALIADKRRTEGIVNVVSALIEDFITSGTEDAANGLAWRLLAGVGYGRDQLVSIGGLVTRTILKPEDALDINALLKGALEHMGIQSEGMAKKWLLTGVPIEGELDAPFKDILTKYGISLSGNDKDRVFLGGSYRNIALLKEIEIIIKGRLKRKNLIPELVSNHVAGRTIDDSDMHGLCMGILDRCSYAVFEVSFESGALMEIEYCYNQIHNDLSCIKVVLIWQKETKKKRNKPPVSSMMMSKGFTRNPYIDLVDLVNGLNKFFK